MYFVGCHETLHRARNTVKTSRRWFLGFNWISRKISRKRWISEGWELTKGRNVQLPAVHGCHEITHRVTVCACARVHGARATVRARAPRRNTCLGFNWIRRKCGENVEETLNTSNGANLRRGETSSYPPFASASSAVRAVYAVRCFVTPAVH